jgi:hypothetical protein
VREGFALEPHMLSDSIHLNTIGAAEFSRHVAAAVAGREAPPAPPVAVPQVVSARAPDPGWTLFTALLAKPAGAPTRALWLEYLQNWGVRYLGAHSNVALSMRTSAGEVLLAPARVVAPGKVVADVSGVRFAPGAEVVSATLMYRNPRRVDPVDLPLAAYRWSQDLPQLDYQARLGSASVETSQSVYSAIARIGVKWAGIDGPSQTDWVGVFPLGQPDAPRVSYGHTRGGASGSMSLAPAFTPGEYELRLYRNDGMEVMATSKPFRLEAVVGEVAVREPAAPAGGAFTVSWRGLNHPHRGDWVGLFPKGRDDVTASARTGGEPEGSVRLPVKKGVAAGDYEVRLYSSGGWLRLAQVPVRVVAP